MPGSGKLLETAHMRGASRYGRSIGRYSTRRVTRRVTRMTRTRPLLPRARAIQVWRTGSEGLGRRRDSASRMEELRSGELPGVNVCKYFQALTPTIYRPCNTCPSLFRLAVR